MIRVIGPYKKIFMYTARLQFPESLEYRDKEHLAEFFEYPMRSQFKDYLKEPAYPTKRNFLSQFGKGYTSTFVKDYNRLLKYKPELKQLLLKIIDKIQRNPLPTKIKQNPRKRMNWECLFKYTEVFRKYLESIDIHERNSYVISYSIGVNCLDKSFERTSRTNLRLIYEVIGDTIIFTNIDYHHYRDSLYSVTEEEL